MYFSCRTRKDTKRTPQTCGLIAFESALLCAIGSPNGLCTNKFAQSHAASRAERPRNHADGKKEQIFHGGRTSPEPPKSVPKVIFAHSITAVGRLP